MWALMGTGGPRQAHKSANGQSSIDKLKAEGTTCIFITHNLHHVFPVSDRLITFARGEKISDVYKKDTSVEELTRMITHD